ncbi:MAG: AmmeMemoRadiSam system radical SAM enzyme [Proteobacteria bacterium]|nr:AmmeMemoRadiSam system radical SAM enzyme [Pseudomonadota bacterium]
MNEASVPDGPAAIQAAPESFDGAPGRYWQRLPDGRVQCDLCPRQCRIHEGQRGLCFVRAATADGIVLTTWGRSSGFCIDPIEKKPLNHFLPGTPVLSFGTAGCNLTCKFCQNWDMSKSREMDILADAASPELLAASAQALGCRSVAFTYNDPTIFLEYAVDIAQACHESGIRTVAVTAGYISPAPRAEFYRHLDAANIDLKAFDDKFYRELCTVRLGDVLETLQYVHHETDTWLEVTTLLIPGHNDSDAELVRLADWFVRELGPDVPLHFSAFHPDYRMRDVPPTPHETLLRARRIALDAGLHHVYVGNVHDTRAGSTYCHSCGALLIERDWYKLGAWNLDAQGNCSQCGAACAGVFDGPPGAWGPRRQPVNLRRLAAERAAAGF